MVVGQALVTALLSGIFSGAVLFALNERRDRANLILSKTEAAVEAYQTAVDTLSRWPLSHFGLFFEGNRENAERSIEEIWTSGRAAMAKARVLIEIYLPDVQNPIVQLSTTLAPFIDISRDIRLAALNGNPLPEDAQERIQTAGRSIVETGATGLDTLLIACRERVHAPHLVRLPRKRRVR